MSDLIIVLIVVGFLVIVIVSIAGNRPNRTIGTSDARRPQSNDYLSALSNNLPEMTDAYNRVVGGKKKVEPLTQRGTLYRLSDENLQVLYNEIVEELKRRENLLQTRKL